MSKFCVAILLLCCLRSFAQSDPCKPAVNITTPSPIICLGTSANFSAVITNDGTGGVYTWKRNDQAITVSNSASYAVTNLHDGDLISCEYSCKTTCGRDTVVASPTIKMQVPNAIQPIVAVANNDPLICEGQITSFTATGTYGTAQPANY